MFPLLSHVDEHVTCKYINFMRNMLTINMPTLCQFFNATQCTHLKWILKGITIPYEAH